jgi:hypothetical protein
MRYFYVEPEVAGGLGDTILDTSVHPPLIGRLHYRFDGWLGDVLLESFPSFIVTENAKNKLVEGGATGVRFDRVEVTTSDLFEEIYPGRKLPKFAWLQVIGQPGKDDFGVAADHRLVMSERALDMLKRLQLSHALIEPFAGETAGHVISQ